MKFLLCWRWLRFSLLLESSLCHHALSMMAKRKVRLLRVDSACRCRSVLITPLIALAAPFTDTCFQDADEDVFGGLFTVPGYGSAGALLTPCSVLVVYNICVGGFLVVPCAANGCHQFNDHITCWWR